MKRYQERLAENQERASAYNKELKTPTLNEKKELMKILSIQNKKLQRKTNRWKDTDLDTLILPHPLLGKMPIREIVDSTSHSTPYKNLN